eukprot:GHVS01089816.1.p1 GENE.GHVS01089816.1~~GHVS01089816.1.p1  ORF type:complete len:213 (+),score=35.57 GHVS01089816.1:264-902(+)
MADCIRAGDAWGTERGETVSFTAEETAVSCEDVPPPVVPVEQKSLPETAQVPRTSQEGGVEKEEEQEGEDVGAELVESFVEEVSSKPNGIPLLDMKNINRRGSIASRLTAVSLATHRTDMDTSRTCVLITERASVDVASCVAEEEKMSLIPTLRPWPKWSHLAPSSPRAPSRAEFIMPPRVSKDKLRRRLGLDSRLQKGLFGRVARMWLFGR